MLYLFHGPDTSTSATKARALVKSLRTKRPDATFVEIDADHWNVSAIQEHAGGQGLFSAKYIILLDRVTENAEAKEQISNFTDIMKDSDNIFIILEGKLNVDLKKSLEKHAEKVVVSEVKEAATSFKKDFNIFALGDALGARNSFKSWSIFRQAIEAGNEIEGILGTLFWQVKSIMVASDAASVAASGLSPFVFAKSKKYASNYSKNELGGLLENLIIIYHDGHRGVTDMELATEQLLLSLR
jgi:DNA polymerase III delta subunit